MTAVARITAPPRVIFDDMAHTVKLLFSISATVEGTPGQTVLTAEIDSFGMTEAGKLSCLRSQVAKKLSDALSLARGQAVTISEPDIRLF